MLGDLRVREAAEVGQLDDLALLVGQRVERRGIVSASSRRAASTSVRSRASNRSSIPSSLARRRSCTTDLRSASMARLCTMPSTHVRTPARAVVTTAGAPDRQERLLGHVLGQRALAAHAVGERERGAAVPLVDGLERPRLALGRRAASAPRQRACRRLGLSGFRGRAMAPSRTAGRTRHWIVAAHVLAGLARCVPYGALGEPAHALVLLRVWRAGARAGSRAPCPRRCPPPPRPTGRTQLRGSRMADSSQASSSSAASSVSSTSVSPGGWRAPRAGRPGSARGAAAPRSRRCRPGRRSVITRVPPRT